jgi:hypothetical protein
MEEEEEVIEDDEETTPVQMIPVQETGRPGGGG